MSETVISLNDLTNTTDTLVELVKVRLNEEFVKGRITGKEYSSVYLGGLNTAIQQSLEFVLQKDQAAAQVNLIKKQQELAAADLLLKQKQLEQLHFEVLKAEQEYLLTVLMKAKTEAETALLVQKKITEEGQPAVMDKQKALYDAQIQGFADDNTQKSSRLITEMWNTLTVADPDLAVTPTNFEAAINAITNRVI